MCRLLPFLAILFLLSAGLSGCGFHPLYGTHSTASGAPSVQDALNRIYIENIPDREGQYLRNALIDRFYTGGRPDNPAYTLSFLPLAESIRDLDVTKSSDATRAQLRLTTKMQLVDRATGKVLLTRDLTAITSYNILKSQFTTRVSEQNTRENALDDLARQAESQLALYFKRAM